MRGNYGDHATRLVAQTHFWAATALVIKFLNSKSTKQNAHTASNLLHFFFRFFWFNWPWFWNNWGFLHIRESKVTTWLYGKCRATLADEFIIVLIFAVLWSIKNKRDSKMPSSELQSLAARTSQPYAQAHIFTTWSISHAVLMPEVFCLDRKFLKLIIWCINWSSKWGKWTLAIIRVCTL